jgi:cytochrome bd-type quinol oxidase subunit 1
MSLKAFHVAFITASVLLAFYFAAWCLGLGESAGASWRAAGIASAAAGLGLVAYEAWFLRKMGRLP